MKIAINCIYFTPKGGGITEYIYNLLSVISKLEFQDDLIIYTTSESKKDIFKIVRDKARIKVFPYAESQKYKRSFFQQSFWSKEEKIEKFELFHSPFFHAPRFKKAKTILTVHDLRFLNYPKTYRFPRLVYLRHVVKNSIKRANHLITISNFTKNEIIKFYNIDESKISVIHEAVNRQDFKNNDNSTSKKIQDTTLKRESFILAVGHLEPRKNYISLIQAYNKIPQEHKTNYKLIIVGKKNHDFDDILNQIQNSDHVSHLNFVSREELIWLYANCKIHIFPSFYEGFGFPSLEAGLFGKPTLGANQSSIPEIAGKGGVYFDPFKIEDIASTMNDVLSDTKRFDELSKNASNNTKLFSWEQNGKRTWSLYQQIGNE